jgi:hypothetical protein
VATDIPESMSMPEPAAMSSEYVSIMTNHMIEKYYTYVLFSDISDSLSIDNDLAPPTNVYKSKTGWKVYEGPNYVLVTPGKTAFNEYGYRNALIETISETAESVVASKGWLTIVAEGPTSTVTAKAWVLLDQKAQENANIQTTAFPINSEADGIKAQKDVFNAIADVVTRLYPK